MDETAFLFFCTTQPQTQLLEQLSARCVQFSTLRRFNVHAQVAVDFIIDRFGTSHNCDEHCVAVCKNMVLQIVKVEPEFKDPYQLNECLARLQLMTNPSCRGTLTAVSRQTNLVKFTIRNHVSSRPVSTRTKLNVQQTTCHQHQYQQKQRRTEHQLLSFHLVTFNWSYCSAFQWWPSSALTACHAATVPIGRALLARPGLTRILKCRLKASQIELILAWTEDVH